MEIKRFLNNRIGCYVFIGLLAFVYRIYVNFNQELILGINGGYYPLQVRYVLENGSLGFSDMPLLFYVNAFIIRIYTFFGVPISNSLILNVVKWVDCFSFPLLLLPLYKIIQLQNRKLPFKLELGLVLFAVLSISPLILVADLQKNALAITFFFSFIAYLWSFFVLKEYRQIIIASIFLVLTGLTHFGTFVVTLFFGLICIGYFFGKRAVIPLLVTALFSLVLIGKFDFFRFYRLLTIGSSVFSRSAILNGMVAPPDIVNILFSLSLAILGISFLKNKNYTYISYQKGFILASIILLIALSFPFLEGQYFRRLSLYLFIPQIVIIILIAQQAKKNLFFKISYLLYFITFVSCLMVMGRPKKGVIDHKSFEDLKLMKAVIINNDKTIVVAKHGLEWWAAWVLHTKVAQEKAIGEDFNHKYENIYFLHQNRKKIIDEEQIFFPEPQLPENSVLIYSSDFFKLYINS